MANPLKKLFSGGKGAGLASGETMLKFWNTAEGVPGGKALFSRFVGELAPYTGTLGGRVDALEPGYARILLKDRRRVRNHLRSIHAIALANLGEMATGLAMLAGLPSSARGILTGISMEYLKKARGTLTAECHAPSLDSITERREYDVVGEIKNAEGVLVARATAKWLIGPRDEKRAAKAPAEAAPASASASAPANPIAEEAPVEPVATAS